MVVLRPGPGAILGSSRTSGTLMSSACTACHTRHRTDTSQDGHITSSRSHRIRSPRQAAFPRGCHWAPRWDFQLKHVWGTY